MTLDRDNARALIAEARETLKRPDGADLIYAEELLMRDLADALESALSAVPVEGDRAHLARSIVNQVLGGAVECGAYDLADMKKRQEYNDVADAFVARLLPALPVEGEASLPRCGFCGDGPDSPSCPTHRAVGGEVGYPCSFSLDECLCDLPKGHTGMHECKRHRFSTRAMAGEVTP